MIHRTILLLALIGISAATQALGLPQFSLLSGNRCSNCHIQQAGGGIRNSLGWYSYQDVSIIKRDAALVKWMYSDKGENTLFDSNFTVGIDFRAQTTRSFYDSSAPRVWFPMQATAYGSYQLWADGLIEGMFNFAALRKAPNSPTAVRYPGQRAWMASAIVGIDSSLPRVRAGIFRPAYGMRYDDHTMFPYSYMSPTSRQTFLAPDWGEAGVELQYEKLHWLSLSAGVFGTSGLSNLILSDGLTSFKAVSGNAPTISARAIAWPRFMEDLVNSYVGASVLNNGDFMINSFFGGVGLTDDISLMLDYTMTSKTNVLSSANFMVDVGWNFWSPIIASARFEHGSTKYAQYSDNTTANSIVVGAQVFVLPYVEVRPEYRVWDTNLDGYIARWNMQLHIFY